MDLWQFTPLHEAASKARYGIYFRLKIKPQLNHQTFLSKIMLDEAAKQSDMVCNANEILDFKKYLM